MSLKPLLVVKFGTSAITKKNGEPDDAIIARIAKEICELHKTHNIVLVSSGAVGAGKAYIKSYNGSISKRKAAAAVGNPLLIVKYSDAFKKHGIQVAQSLCERSHFANRELFVQLKETYQELWLNNIIPIANENDVISERELKFSDNDELATLIAVGFNAERLMIATDAGGLLNKQDQIVTKVAEINQEVMSYVNTKKTALGLGGMSSKLTFAKLATRMGVKVSIFGIKEHQGGVINAFNEETGSTFEAKEANISARNKWLASGGLTSGKLKLDMGAVEALFARKSLLSVGIVEVFGTFSKGEIVELVDSDDKVVAIARSREAANSLSQKKQNLVVAHADDIVLV